MGNVPILVRIIYPSEVADSHSVENHPSIYAKVVLTRSTMRWRVRFHLHALCALLSQWALGSWAYYRVNSPSLLICGLTPGCFLCVELALVGRQYTVRQLGAARAAALRFAA